jgi:hypothetical protein
LHISAYGRRETLLTGDTGRQLSPWAIERAMRKARGKVKGLPEGFRYHDLRHYFASLLKVSGVASAASFDGTGGRALPAVQRAALGQPLGNESPCTMPELGCHHEVATGRTMMQPVQLQAIPE